MKTREEAFEEIMSGVEIVQVQHLTFLMKYNSGTKEKEFVADLNTEDDSMYFSYRKVWGIFREKYQMKDEEIKDFLSKMIYINFGFNVKPY